MISDTMEKALNDQINLEMSSGYVYWAMASCADEMGLSGVANWYTLQAQEEMGHATRIYQYLKDQRAHVEFEAIAKPRAKYESVVEIAEQALGHEQTVTASINALVKLAKSEDDAATEVFLQWFVTEQVEEEANAENVIERAKLAGVSGPGLFMLDRELAQRQAGPK